jgi:hypothetical protein
MLFAVVTISSVLIYDTQHPHPLMKLSGIHYAAMNDAAWSADGRMLAVCSSDGYLTFIRFQENVLGELLPDEMIPKSVKLTYPGLYGTAATTTSNSNYNNSLPLPVNKLQNSHNNNNHHPPHPNNNSNNNNNNINQKSSKVSKPSTTQASSNSSTQQSVTSPRTSQFVSPQENKPSVGGGPTVIGTPSNVEVIVIEESRDGPETKTPFKGSMGKTQPMDVVIEIDSDIPQQGDQQLQSSISETTATAAATTTTSPSTAADDTLLKKRKRIQPIHIAPLSSNLNNEQVKLVDESQSIPAVEEFVTEVVPVPTLPLQEFGPGAVVNTTLTPPPQQKVLPKKRIAPILVSSVLSTSPAVVQPMIKDDNMVLDNQETNNK